MKRRISIALLFCMIAALLAGCSITKYGTEEKYKEMLASKYNFQQITTIEFRGAHKEKQGRGEFGSVVVNIPAYGKFQCDNRVVTVFDGKDDYYYDELVAGVQNYYKQKFDTDQVYVSVGGSLIDNGYCDTKYGDFFKSNSVIAVDEACVTQFLKEYAYNVTVILQKNINETDEQAVERVKAVINSNNDGINISVQLMSTLSGITERYVKPNYYNFDDYFIEGINYDNRIDRISTEE